MKFSSAPTSSLISVYRSVLPTPEPWADTTWCLSSTARLGQAGSIPGTAGVSFSLSTSPLKDKSLWAVPCPNCIIPLAQRTKLYLTVIEAAAAWALWRITALSPGRSRLHLSAHVLFYISHPHNQSQSLFLQHPDNWFPTAAPGSCFNPKHSQKLREIARSFPSFGPSLVFALIAFLIAKLPAQHSST